MKEKLRSIIKQDGLTILIVAVLVIAYLVLRTPGNTFDSANEVVAQLAGGQPTVVELYSNRCSICLASKPKVDQLERDLVGQAPVLRVNVASDAGKQLAYQWQVAGVPTFFVFDGEGQVVYRRSGAPDVAAIKSTVAGINTQAN